MKADLMKQGFVKNGFCKIAATKTYLFDISIEPRKVFEITVFEGACPCEGVVKICSSKNSICCNNAFK